MKLVKGIQIEKITKEDYFEIIDLWEISVRKTHHFLEEKDIQYFKPLILNEYLDAVSLNCIKNEKGSIVGFIGTKEDKIEMLFVLPSYFRKGIGSFLVEYALKELNIKKVSVNEQNPNAVKFYEKMDFKVCDRQEIDDMGKPFPILHMKVI